MKQGEDRGIIVHIRIKSLNVSRLTADERVNECTYHKEQGESIIVASGDENTAVNLVGDQRN